MSENSPVNTRYDATPTATPEEVEGGKIAALSRNISKLTIESPHVVVADGIAWSYYIVDNGIEIVGAKTSGEFSGKVVIPDQLEGKPVIRIGEEVFANCKLITSITIPNSVVEIGDYAFFNCEGLTSLTIPENVEIIGQNAFWDCWKISSLAIPKKVKSIGNCAFAYWYSLTSIKVDDDNPYFDSRKDCNAIIETATNTLVVSCQKTVIPNSVNTLRNYAFFGCGNLQSIVIPRSVTSIEYGNFNACYSLTSIIVDENNPIYDSRNNCNAIIETASNTLIAGCTKTNIPNGIVKIGNSAFWGCNGLKSFAIPNSVKEIGNGAFGYCEDIESIAIPNSVNRIEGSAFYCCKKLSSIYIPSSVNSIGDKAFAACISMTSMQVDKENKVFDSRDDCNAIILTSKNSLLSGCQTTYIPDDIEEIRQYAFYGCYSLKTINIPNSVKTIGDYAFQGKEETLGHYQDEGDVVIDGIMCYIKEPYYINDNVFDDYSAKLYVPKGTTAKYKEISAWNRFNIIEEMVDKSVCDIDDLQKFIDLLGRKGEKGTEENPTEVPMCESGEIKIDDDLDLDDDFHIAVNNSDEKNEFQVIFDGGRINIMKQTCGMSFIHVAFSSTKSTGSTKNVIESKGKLSFDNCLFNTGDYLITNLSGGKLILKNKTEIRGLNIFTNNGIVYTDGTCTIKELINTMDGKIYVTQKLSREMNINMSSVKSIGLNSPIIEGADGYELSEEDMRYIHITLPENYAYRYSKWNKSVVICLAKTVTLQERLDALTPGEATVIDLTSEGFTGYLDGPIIVRKGVNAQFINGTIETNYGIRITNDSQLELGKNATIKGNISSDFYTPDGNPSLIYLDGGTFVNNEGGCLQNEKQSNARNVSSNTRQQGFNKIIIASTYYYSVWLTKDNDKFIMKGGTIIGEVITNYVHSEILIEGGEINSPIIGESIGYNEISIFPTIKQTGGNIVGIGGRYSNFGGNVVLEGGSCKEITLLREFKSTGNANVERLIVTRDDGHVSIGGGKFNKVISCSDVYLSSEAIVEEMALYDERISDGNTVLWLTSPLTNKIKIGCTKETDDIIVKGSDYSISDSDRTYVQAFSCIKDKKETGLIPIIVGDGRVFYDNYNDLFIYKHALKLQDNALILSGEKAEELPATGCDQDWLQQKLDEIAAQKPSEPVELTICEDGMTLTKSISVAKDCKALLTGGPITSAEAIDYNHGAEGLFMVYGEMGFHDISLTFNNDAKGDGSLGYFWLSEGTLELNKGTAVSTNNGTVVGGYGKLDITDAVIFAGGEEKVISSNINTTISDCVELYGQQTYCNGKIAVDMKTNPETGMARFPIIRVNKVYVTSSLDLWAPHNLLLNNFYLYKDASINTYENGFMQMQITGEWNQMAVGIAFVTSTSIGQNDYNRMTFMSMPINRRAEFVPGSHQVRLMSTSQIDIQTSLSGLNYVSQTDQTTLYLSADAVNTVYQPTTINHQNVTFNGMPNGATSRARIHFSKDQILTISKDGRLTLTNIDVTGEDESVGFEVYGKIIISENVHVSDLSCFLRIYSGGSVYASAGLRSPVSIQFANGLASGSTVIAGTDGYQLTETDLAYVTVEGCELQLDKDNNRIIASNGTGIETINDNPRMVSQEGTYDLGGRKVIPTRQGVYIIREGKVAKKVYVK